MPRGLTPERLFRRSGVLLATLAGLAGLAACDLMGGATIELDEGSVTLEGGAELHEVTVGGSGGRDTLDPTTVTAQPGDAVRFVVADHRTHALAFAGEGLETTAAEFLERTAQLRGPPLVNEGAAWVVSLADAPPGRYPFLCRSHQERGVVIVGGED